MSRGWTDDGDKVVECDLAILTAIRRVMCRADRQQPELRRRVGNITQVNQDTLKGWGARDYDWQWSVGAQQQVLPRVSVDVAYSRRSFYSFTVTDNQARTPSQYDAWTINAPTDARLARWRRLSDHPLHGHGRGGSDPGAELHHLGDRFRRRALQLLEGVDFTVNARVRQGLTVQFGTNTGRKIDDTCATVVKIDSPDPRDCRLAPPYQTTARGLASYTIPRVDVLVSATVRSQPPLPLTADVGRAQHRRRPGSGPPAAGRHRRRQHEHRPARQRASAVRGQSPHQIDMRVAKVFRFGKKRLNVGVDGENLLNTNYPTTYDSTYRYSAGNTTMGGTWSNPTAIYTPRSARLNFTFNF